MYHIEFPESDFSPPIVEFLWPHVATSGCVQEGNGLWGNVIWGHKASHFNHSLFWVNNWICRDLKCWWYAKLLNMPIRYLMADETAQNIFIWHPTIRPRPTWFSNRGKGVDLYKWSKAYSLSIALFLCVLLWDGRLSISICHRSYVGSYWVLNFTKFFMTQGKLHSNSDLAWCFFSYLK